MERYFRITEQASLHKAWFAYKENAGLVQELVKSFLLKFEIESQEYSAIENDLYIVPSKNDAETYNNVLNSAVGEGLRKFKSTSKVGKAWIETLKTAGLVVLQKPRLIFYLRTASGGRFRSRLFDQDGNLYCSLDPAEVTEQKGFEEMKASEFFKIVEATESVPA